MGRFAILVALIASSVGWTSASDCAMVMSCQMKMNVMGKIGPDNTCTPEVRAEAMEVNTCMREMFKSSLNIKSCPRVMVPPKYRTIFKKLTESSFSLACTGCPISQVSASCYRQRGPGTDRCDLAAAATQFDEEAACVVGRLQNEPLCADQMEKVDRLNAAYKEKGMMFRTEMCAGKGKGGKKRGAPVKRMWPDLTSLTWK